MKLRIVQRGSVFVPQYYKDGYYNKWNGFGAPNIKFRSQDLAESFIKLVQQSVPTTTGITKVVYQNYEAPKVKVK